MSLVSLPPHAVGGLYNDRRVARFARVQRSSTEGMTQSEDVVTPAKQNDMNETSMMGTSVTMKIPQLDTADSDQWSGTLSLPDGDHSRVKFRPTHSHK